MTTTLAITDMSPINLLKALPGWEDMNAKDKAFFEKETKGLAEACSRGVMSKIDQGKSLCNIKAKATPAQFKAYWKMLNYKKATAYDYMRAFTIMSKRLRPSLVSLAAARGMNILGTSEDAPYGVWTENFKRMPPPDTDDPIVNNQFLDEAIVRQTRIDGRSRKMVQIEDDAEVLLQHSYQFVSRRLQKLPNKGRSRKAWIERLVGMLLSEIGVSGNQSFQAEAVPDDFKPRPVGRPRTIEAA